MATGTGPFDSQDVLNRVFKLAGTAPTGDTDSLVVYLSDRAVKASGTSQPADPTALITQPTYRAFILDSVALGSASATGTNSTALGGLKIIDVYTRFSSMTGTASTIDLFVDSRVDGTNYTNIGHFSQILSATGPTADVVMRLIKIPGTPLEVQGLRADAGAGTVRNIGWGDDLRIRRDVSGGTTSPIFSYTVTLICIS